MDNIKSHFKKYVAQTKYSLYDIDVDKAEGIYIWDKSGKKYIDMISGISVNNLGHRHPNIIKAIKDQSDKYLHSMVYGEYIQSPQVELAKLLSDNLPKNLSVSFFVNSGSEAIDGAIKLSKKYNGRSEIIACKRSYHGSTIGAMSLSHNKYNNNFRPLIPDVKFIEFNNLEDLEKITENTSCVLIEPIQAAAGIILPENDFLINLSNKCKETGTLLIFDEVQTAGGRTGKLFAFENFNIVPDILVLAKSIGGGMPLGVFTSSAEIMQCLNDNHPLLGHATTFGGHPISCATSISMIKTLFKEKLIDSIQEKNETIKQHLKNKKIKEIRGMGLFLAIDFKKSALVKKLLKSFLKNGIISSWFLFNDTSLFLAPPLTISKSELESSCKIIDTSINETEL